MNACPRCENEITPELFEQEVVCDKCGALLKVDYEEEGIGFLINLTEVII